MENELQAHWKVVCLFVYLGRGLGSYTSGLRSLADVHLGNGAFQLKDHRPGSHVEWV